MTCVIFVFNNNNTAFIKLLLIWAQIFSQEIKNCRMKLKIKKPLQMTKFYIAKYQHDPHLQSK